MSTYKNTMFTHLKAKERSFMTTLNPRQLTEYYEL